MKSAMSNKLAAISWTNSPATFQGLIDDAEALKAEALLVQAAKTADDTASEAVATAQVRAIMARARPSLSRADPSPPTPRL